MLQILKELILSRLLTYYTQQTSFGGHPRTIMGRLIITNKTSVVCDCNRLFFMDEAWKNVC